jgi:hypothetical protein
MRNWDELKYTALKNIRAELQQVNKISETFNKNFVAYSNMVQKDIQQHTFKPVDPRELKPRYGVDCQVVVFCEGHVRDGWRGVIQELGGTNALVRFDDGEYCYLKGSEMIPLDELPLKPEKTCDIPVPPSVQEWREEQNAGVTKAGNPFHPDHLGRLYPHQWRHNLGMPGVFATNPITGRESEPMTEEAFRIYNAGVWKGRNEQTR